MRRVRRQWETHGSAIRWGAVLVSMLLFVLAVGSWRWFVRPTTDDPSSADAVVLFSGGSGERLATAIELLEDGVGDALVIPNGNHPDWLVASRLCSEPQAFDVHCFTPGTNDARAEARGIGFLVDVNGWDNLVAVTSTYNVTRARALLGRCTDADIAVVGADPNLSVVDWTARVGGEWLASAAALTFKRSC